MKILGVDFGERRTGIAVSDALGITAQGVKTIFESDYKITAEKVLEELKLQGAEKIVLGMPKNMDGSIGFRGDATLKFKEYLETLTDAKIILWDERLTTVSAIKTLNETNVRGKKRKNIIDTVAATYILQGYLDSISR